MNNRMIDGKLLALILSVVIALTPIVAGFLTIYSKIERQGERLEKTNQRLKKIEQQIKTNREEARTDIALLRKEFNERFITFAQTVIRLEK